MSCYLSGTVYGSQKNPKLTYSGSLKLKAGINKLSLLSAAVGLPVGVCYYRVTFSSWLRLVMLLLTNYDVSFRMLESTTRGGTWGFSARWLWRASILGCGTCRHGSGPTRFVAPLFAPSPSKKCIHVSSIMTWNLITGWSERRSSESPHPQWKFHGRVDAGIIIGSEPAHAMV